MLNIQNTIKNITIIDDLNLKNKTFVGVLDIKYINDDLNLLSYLPKNRAKYAKNFKNKIRKKQTIAADLILLYLLDEFFNVKNVDIISNTYIEINNSKIYFNKSHSKNLALCAVSNTAIGVDIQYHKNLKFQEKIAKKYFNKDEIKLLKNKENFFDIWAKKEAKVKLLGKGINSSNEIDCSNMNFININYKKIKNYSICIAQIK